MNLKGIKEQSIEVTNTEVTAQYVKTDNKEGFLSIMFALGETIILLHDNISQAGMFGSKEQILELLNEDNFKYNEITFIAKTTKSISEYTVI